MSRFLATLATVALILTALADVAARQQSQTSSSFATISGRAEIVDTNQHAPLRRATVTLRSESGTLTKTTATDANGAYRFDCLAAGKYRVTVEKAGFLNAVLATPGVDSADPFPELSVASGAQHVVNFVA